MNRLASLAFFFGALSLACGAPPLECDDDEEEDDGECVSTESGDADTDTDADTDADVEVEVDYSAESTRVNWEAAANTGTSGATLYIIDTGDPAFEGGCDVSDFGGRACSVWTEVHDDFVTQEGTNDLGGITRVLSLEMTNDFTDQRTNVSTLFTLDYLEGGNPTWLVLVEGSSGDGCASGGDDPSFFDDLCP